MTCEPFCTIIAEARVEKVDDFFVFEQKLMANENVLKSMANYHELVESGRRDVFRVEE